MLELQEKNLNQIQESGPVSVSGSTGTDIPPQPLWQNHLRIGLIGNPGGQGGGEGMGAWETGDTARVGYPHPYCCHCYWFSPFSFAYLKLFAFPFTEQSFVDYHPI